MTLLHAFCSKYKGDYSQFVPRLLIGLINLFNDPEPAVVEMAWSALDAVTKVTTSHHHSVLQIDAHTQTDRFGCQVVDFIMYLQINYNWS